MRMQIGSRLTGIYLLISLLALSGVASPAFGQALPTAKPAEVGFSPERLQRLDAAMQQKVDDKQFAGMVTLLARHGKVVDFKAFGKRDLASGAPMEKDAIFRIYSMTKPVTGVAMMLLYEEGKWQPADPISKYIPEFAHLKVFKGVDDSGQPILADPVHPPTMLQLMTHTAGFTYGVFGGTVVDKMYHDQNVLHAGSLQAMIDKLAKIPLLYEPGTRWVYSLSVDIQGYLVEKLSGKPLPDFMRERIFEPLGMKDTGFYVPKEKMNRVATLYHVSDQGEWTAATPENDLAPDLTQPPSQPSGGGGLLSTAQDYFRFAQMLLNGGQLDGVRLLAPPTVRLMTSNHLPDKLMTGSSAWVCSTSGRAWALASTSRCLAIPLRPWTSPARALTCGTAPPPPGSGSIPAMTWCLSAWSSAWAATAPTCKPSAAPWCSNPSWGSNYC